MRYVLRTLLLALLACYLTSANAGNSVNFSDCFFILEQVQSNLAENRGATDWTAADRETNWIAACDSCRSTADNVGLVKSCNEKFTSVFESSFSIILLRIVSVFVTALLPWLIFGRKRVKICLIWIGVYLMAQAVAFSGVIPANAIGFIVGSAVIQGGVALLVVVYKAFRFLIRKHPRTIYLGFWAYSLAGVVVFITLCIAHTDQQDMAKTTQYGWYAHAMGVYLNVVDDIYVAMAVIAAVFIPQFMAYFLAGIFGCAKNPVLIRKTGEWIFVFLCKAIIGGAGGWAGLAVFQMIFSVKITPLSPPVSLFETIVSLFYPFSMLSFYYYLKSIDWASHDYFVHSRTINWVRRFATRNLPQEH